MSEPTLVSNNAFAYEAKPKLNISRNYRNYLLTNVKIIGENIHDDDKQQPNVNQIFNLFPLIFM